MVRLTRPPGLRRTAVTALAGLMLIFGIMASAGAASADTNVKATYPVTGSTFIAAPNFTLALGPGKLAATADLTTGAVKANLRLPNATGTFKQFGLIPVTATTQLINNGPTRGKINLTTGAVRTTSHITLRLVDLKVAGIDMPVGDSCETSTPTAVKVVSQPGFTLFNGGNLSGTYTIPQFANCGLATALINLTIPGSGNTITLTLGKPTFGG
jgi:hypothetical protein